LTHYQQLAIDLALNPKRLSTIKERLQEAVNSSPLFNSDQFTKDLEDLYLQLMNDCQNKMIVKRISKLSDDNPK
jgi:predicted O-linked N-acetylglucosamine transferase (SPINDLY family)